MLDFKQFFHHSSPFSYRETVRKFLLRENRIVQKMEGGNKEFGHIFNPTKLSELRMERGGWKEVRGVSLADGAKKKDDIPSRNGRFES